VRLMICTQCMQVKVKKLRPISTYIDNEIVFVGVGS